MNISAIKKTFGEEYYSNDPASQHALAIINAALWWAEAEFEKGFGFKREASSIVFNDFGDHWAGFTVEFPNEFYSAHIGLKSIFDKKPWLFPSTFNEWYTERLGVLR